MALVIWLLFWAPAYLCHVFLALVYLLAAYEWSAFLYESDSWWRLAYVIGMGILALLSALLPVTLIMGIGVGWWLFGSFLVYCYPVLRTWWSTQLGLGIMSVFILLPFYMGLSWLYQSDWSSAAILFVLLIVWSADIGAFFSGRYFGQHALAKMISPNKTWEGVAGGVLLAVAVSAVGLSLWRQPGAWSMVAGLILLVMVILTALISVIGDLIESMVKRHRGVKDSGNLIPGHGGILDRIDALTAAVPCFVLMFWYAQQHIILLSN